MKVIVGAVNEELDPMQWAKYPRSQFALDAAARGAREGHPDLTRIFYEHVASGVCDENGRAKALPAYERAIGERRV